MKYMLVFSKAVRGMHVPVFIKNNFPQDLWLKLTFRPPPTPSKPSGFLFVHCSMEKCTCQKLRASEDDVDWMSEQFSSPANYKKFPSFLSSEIIYLPSTDKTNTRQVYIVGTFKKLVFYVKASFCKNHCAVHCYDQFPPWKFILANKWQSTVLAFLEIH